MRINMKFWEDDLIVAEAELISGATSAEEALASAQVTNLRKHQPGVKLLDPQIRVTLESSESP